MLFHFVSSCTSYRNTRINSRLGINNRFPPFEGAQDHREINTSTMLVETLLKHGSPHVGMVESS